jgi:galactose oxidase
MNGGAVMFDIGKVFTAGGSESYDYSGAPASNRAYIIDISSPGREPMVERQPDMAWRRSLLNVVALPNGMIVVAGGQTNTELFSDNFGVLHVEMYDPVRKAWFEFSQPLKKARNYHSVGLLLRDGRVLCGGGGLCATDCDLETEFVSGDAVPLPMLVRIYLNSRPSSTISIRTTRMWKFSRLPIC